MKSIKFFVKNQINYALMNDVLYTGYTVGDLPQRFGYILTEESDSDGYDRWFNNKGLTYIIKDE